MNSAFKQVYLTDIVIKHQLGFSVNDCQTKKLMKNAAERLKLYDGSTFSSTIVKTKLYLFCQYH